MIFGTHSKHLQVQQGTNLEDVANEVGQLLVELDLLLALLDLANEALQLLDPAKREHM